MMETGSTPQPAQPAALRIRRTADAVRTRGSSEAPRRARNAELAGRLRAAAIEGDDAYITELLSELLRLQGLPKGQRISLQLTALLNLVHSLRCLALTDEITGL